MTRVLVVDDETDYREELELALASDGHEIRTAGNGSEAIDVGVRFLPDVLVVDWMLRNVVHGLHVSEALRAVCPALQTVLITGFASHDLRSEAARRLIFDFIEKPFDLERIQSAVRGAASTPAQPGGRIPLGVMHLDADGRTTYANPAARDLLTAAGLDESPRKLAENLAPADSARLEASTHGWVSVASPGPAASPWHVRARVWPDYAGRLLFLLADADQHYKHHPLVRILLNVGLQESGRWPLNGRALIIDPEPLVRRVVVAELERCGCFCHAAENARRGMTLLERDADVAVIVLDAQVEWPGGLGRLVEEMRRHRPGTAIIGTSTVDCAREFAEAGVPSFLPKPWRVDDLINVLTGRIGHCVDCGLPIPLRRPRDGETGGSWVCCGCGSRYYAVMDESFSPQVRGHVRPGDDSAG